MVKGSPYEPILFKCDYKIAAVEKYVFDNLSTSPSIFQAWTMMIRFFFHDYSRISRTVGTIRLLHFRLKSDNDRLITLQGMDGRNTHF